MSIKITCITKDNGNHENPHVAIARLGWINEANGNTGNNSRVEIYDWIKDKGGEAYVKDVFGNVAYLKTALSSKNTKYVKTVADETKTDNLLQLPECK